MESKEKLKFILLLIGSILFPVIFYYFYAKYHKKLNHNHQKPIYIAGSIWLFFWAGLFVSSIVPKPENHVIKYKTQYFNQYSSEYDSQSRDYRRSYYMELKEARSKNEK